MRGIPQIPIQSNILGRYWNEFDPWRPYSYCLLDLALTRKAVWYLALAADPLDMIWYSKWISLGSAETCPIHEGLASQLTGLKGSATTPWCQTSSQVLYPCLDVRVKSSPQWGLHGLNLFKNAPHKLLSEYLFYGVAEDIVIGEWLAMGDVLGLRQSFRG